MASGTKERERALWIAVVAVLATALLWLAMLSGVALFFTYTLPGAQVAAVVRALGHVAVTLAMRAWPALPLFAFGGIMLAIVFRRSPGAKREVRHA